MIQYVLTVSEFFPKTHKKAGQPTGFPLAIKHYDKIYTIRGNYDLWAKRFEKINQGLAFLSIRIWQGKPYKSKQLEIFKYFKTHNIGIERLVLEPKCFTEGSEPLPNINFKFYSPTLIGDLSKNDGLSIEDFNDWFKKYDKSKEMAIIHFTDFRYCR